MLLVALGGALLAPARAASRPPERFPHAAVVSVDERASRVGAAILKRGGSAADALIATALALVVVHPQAGNLTGGHFSLWRGADGTREVIDAREVAPATARPDLFLDSKGRPLSGDALWSPRAAAVPGTVAGLALLHERHGHLDWATLVEPALHLAEHGFRVSPGLASALDRARDRLARDPDTAAIFLPGGKPAAAGAHFLQPDLARTLRILREQGPAALQTGPVARQLAADMERRGGQIRLDDLRRYEPRLRPPLEIDYRNHRVLVPPPPSAGGLAVLQALGTLAAFPIEPDERGGARLIHIEVEALRRAAADRYQWLGDPDFVDVPVRRLVALQRLRDWSRSIRPDRATPSSRLFQQAPASPAEGTDTTHVSVVDRWGNAVAHSTTLNGTFGTQFVARDTGLFWNNEMDDFSIAPGVPNTYGIPGSLPNAIAPGKRPVSSMTPTIVERDGRLAYVLGTPGGATIPSTVLQVMVNMIDLHLDPQEAVDAPRVHHQGLPDRLRFERGTLPPEVRRALTERGHELAPVSCQGDVQLLSVAPDGAILAAPDPRRGGAAAGY